MSQVIFAYLILPFILAWAVIKFLKAFSKNEAPKDVQELYAGAPLARGLFRVIKRDGGGVAILEDCPSHEEALEKAYRALRQAKSAGQKTSFLVLNHEGAAFEQIDA